jgi:DNA-binding NarL/FixJ family response regulator
MKYKTAILFFAIISIYSATYNSIYCSDLVSNKEIIKSNIPITISKDSIDSANLKLSQSNLEQLNQKTELLIKENAFYHNQNKKLLSVIDNYDNQYFVFLTIGFVFISLLALIGILYWREKIRLENMSEHYEKLKSETAFANSIDRNLNEENAQLNEALVSKERELTALTMQLANIQDSIVTMIDKAAVEMKDNKDSKFQVLAKDIRGILSQKDYWSEFMIKFTQIHPNFNTNIKEKYPVLSSKDISFCSLIKLNLSNKEIANLLQVSHESVITKKYLLKKKLALTAEQDLFQVVNSIE